MGVESSQRVLMFLGPTSQAEVSRQAVIRYGHETVICADAGQMCSEIAKGAGALLGAKEFFSEDAISTLKDCLRNQPAWSHLPIVVLLDEGDLATPAEGNLAAARRARERDLVGGASSRRYIGDDHPVGFGLPEKAIRCP
ncbi:MAG: hypothetical protein HC883_03045 [Bdellovibrionaceae bacterium]|nr:hypothetical protein [Pseudobdellovibrionaceae bacterium]